MAIIRIPNKEDGTPLVTDPPEGFVKTGDHLGGKHHNGAESLVRQTDGAIASAVTVTGIGIPEVEGKVIPVTGEFNGRPQYTFYGTYDIGVFFDGAKWKTEVVQFTIPIAINSNTSTAPAPPKTGWVVDSGGYGAPTVAYESFWVDDNGDFVDRSYADYRAHLNGLFNLWLKCQNINGVPHIDESAQYDLAFIPTTQDDLKNENYFGDNCGTGFGIKLFDSTSDPLTDSLASQLFSQG